MQEKHSFRRIPNRPFRQLVNFLSLGSNIALETADWGPRGRNRPPGRIARAEAARPAGEGPAPAATRSSTGATSRPASALTVLGLYLSTPFPDTVLQGSIPAIVGIVVAGLALYRASYFNHELSHQARQLPGFEIGWNLFVGIPLLIPSFLYYDHLNHHSVRGFGTESDIEYFCAEAARPARRACAGRRLRHPAASSTSRAFRCCRRSPGSARRSGIWVDTRASGLGVLGLSRRPPPTADERPRLAGAGSRMLRLPVRHGAAAAARHQYDQHAHAVLRHHERAAVLPCHPHHGRASLRIERRAAGPDRAGARFLQLPEIFICDVDPGAARLPPARAASPVSENPVPQHAARRTAASPRRCRRIRSITRSSPTITSARSCASCCATTKRARRSKPRR